MINIFRLLETRVLPVGKGGYKQAMVKSPMKLRWNWIYQYKHGI